MKDFLIQLITEKRNKMLELQEKSNASEDLAEVRAIGTQLETLKSEIARAEAQLAKLEEEERSTAVPDGAQLRNGIVVSSTGKTDDEEGLEYRKAFMEYIQRGTPIPAEVRGDENTLTSDVSAVIPTQLVNRIIEKMDNVGMILPLISRSSYKGGISIPTSSTKPVASWVSEGSGSDRQKKTTGTSITFTYHKLRCEISMSMEVSVMALSAFEAKFVDNVAKAMIYAIENAIVNGNGTGKPKGILAETPETGQALTITAGAITYADLCAWEAAIPEQYEGTAKWCMSKKTFMAIQAITDDSGQPVARVNYGIGGRPERTILGRDVVIASTYMPNLAAGTANTFAFIFDFSDYLLNTIYDMGITKKQDWETEDMLTKAVMSVDGKVIDKTSLVTVSNVLSV